LWAGPGLFTLLQRLPGGAFLLEARIQLLKITILTDFIESPKSFMTYFQTVL
jgi:hypothetical protein